MLLDIMVSPLGRTLDRGSEVRRHTHLFQHDIERGVAVESLDLAVPQVEEVRAWDVDLCSCWLDHASGCFHRAAKCSLNDSSMATTSPMTSTRWSSR